MTTYIALLRGINVGGKNKIKMADLKRSFESLRLNQVQTYIQSGNVLFVSEESEAVLRLLIERKIEEDFGFPVPVILRTASELERIYRNCPFSEEAIAEAEASSEGECLYVALLLEAPTQEGIERLSAFKTEHEEFQMKGMEVYLLFRQSIRNSKLANQLPKLGVPATVRNWKTISKLTALAEEMEGQSR